MMQDDEEEKVALNEGRFDSQAFDAPSNEINWGMMNKTRLDAKLWEVQINDTVQDDLWECTTCTFLNHSKMLYCEICETERIHPAVNLSKTGSSLDWQDLSIKVASTTKSAKAAMSSSFTQLSNKWKSSANVRETKTVLTSASSTLSRVKSDATVRIKKYRDRLSMRKSTNDEGSLPSKLCMQELLVLRNELQVKCEPQFRTYEVLLERLWDAVYNDPYGKSIQKPFSREGNGWVEMGFQRPNPDTDFRGGGLLALKCLVYLFEVHHEKMRRIQQEQSHEEGKNNYPLCAAGINLTCMLAGILKLGDGSYSKTKEVFWVLFEEPSAFYELFSIAVVIMDQMWYELKASYMSFSDVLSATRKKMNEILSQGPHNLDQVQQIADAMKCLPQQRGDGSANTQMAGTLASQSEANDYI